MTTYSFGRQVLNYFWLLSICLAATGYADAQIINNYAGGCPIQETLPLDNSCIQTHNPNFVESFFLPGAGGSLQFTYDGDLPGTQVTAGTGTVLTTTVTIEEVLNGSVIDMLDCVVTITYEDLTGPIITCLDDKIINGSCQQVFDLTPIIEENCDPSYSYTYDISYPLESNLVNVQDQPGSPEGAIFPIGVSILTYHFPEDINGNSPNVVECSFAIDVKGPAQLPTINSCPDDIITFAGAGACGAQLSINGITASDPCIGGSGLVISNSFNDGGADASGFYPVGNTIVIFKVENPLTGKINSCFINVTVRDNTPPILANCPSDISIELRPGNSINLVSGGPSIQNVDREDCVVILDLNNPTFSDNCEQSPVPRYRIDPPVGLEINGTQGDLTDPDGEYEFGIGTTRVTWFYIDAAQQRTECSIVVTIENDDMPTIVCPVINSSIQIESNTCHKTFNPGDLDPVINGLCTSGTLAWTWSNHLNVTTTGVGTLTDEVFEVGEHTITYTFTDAQLSTTDCSFTFEIEDNEDATITCPEDYVVGVDVGSSTANLSFDPTVEDNCGTVTYTYNINFANGSNADGNGAISNILFPIGTSQVSFSAYDASNNFSACNFTVTVEPFTPSCPVRLSPVYLNASCNAVIDPSIVKQNYFAFQPNPGLEANVNFVGNGTFTAIPTTVNPDPSPESFALVDGANFVNKPGTYLLEYTLEFIDGGIVVAGANPCEVIIEVLDTISPSVVCPENIVIGVNDDIGVPGNCPLIPSQFGYSLTPISQSDCDLTEVSYILEDGIGNQYNSGEGDVSNAIFNPGETQVIYFIKDASGNIQPCNFSVTFLLEDNTPPIFDCPEDLTFFMDSKESCDTIFSNQEFETIVADQCNFSSFPTVTYRILTPSAGTIGPLTGADATDAQISYEPGIYTVEYVAIDYSGNVGNCSFQISIIDRVPPVITGNCPADITINSTTNCIATLANINLPLVEDNCGDYTLTYQVNGATQLSGTGSVNGLAFNPGISTINYTASDSWGNSSESCTFSVTVLESSAPSITCPDDVVINTGNNCSAEVFGIDGNSTDECSSTEVLWQVINPDGSEDFGDGDISGKEFLPGISTVFYFVKDQFDNYGASCSFTVSVIDNITPIIQNCPTNIMRVAEDGACDVAIDIPQLTASDNCYQQLEFRNSFNSNGANLSDRFPIGITVINVIVEDASGNQANCSFTVTVQPSNIQEFCPQDVSGFIDENNCTADFPELKIGSVLDCGSINLSYTVTNPDNSIAQGQGDISSYSFGPGTSQVEYQFVDAEGNPLETCSFLVEVKDDVPPEFTSCPSAITVNPNGNCEAPVTIAPALAFDFCGGVSITNDYNNGGGIANDIYPLGTTTVTFTAVDQSDNKSYCQVLVTVENAFTISCPSDVTAVSTPGNCGVVVNDISPEITGTSCTDAVVSYRWESPDGNPLVYGTGDLSGQEFPVGENKVTYFAVDPPSGCTFTVSVQGNSELPSCPDDKIVEIGSNNCGSAVWNISPINNDCSYLILSQITGATSKVLGPESVEGYFFEKGSSTVTYFYPDPDDPANFKVICSFKVDLIDEEAPTASCPSDIVIETDGITAQLISTGSYENGPPIIGDVFVSQNNCAVSIHNLYPFGIEDNCDVSSIQYEILLPNNSIITSPGNGFNNVSAFQFPVGTSTVTYRVIDNAGELIYTTPGIDVNNNITTCSFKVTVLDKSIPAFLNCQDISIENGVMTDGPGGFQISANDPCYPLFTFADPVIEDICGDVAQVDMILQGATIGKAIRTQDAANAIATGVFANNGATDGINKLTGLTLNPGITEVIYTATDFEGNSNTCGFKVSIIEDSEPFFINCQDQVELQTNTDECGVLMDLILPQVGDNCSNNQVAINYKIEIPPFSGNIVTTGRGMDNFFFPVGQARVIYELEDESGNVNTSAPCTQIVSVKDLSEPILTCISPPNITIPDGAASCEVAVDNIDLIATDNCSAISNYAYSIQYPDGSIEGPISGNASGQLFPIGTSIVTYVVSDFAGNPSSCSFNVNVLQSQSNDDFECPSDVTISLGNSCEALFNLPPLVTSDGCGTQIVEIDEASHSDPGLGAAIESSSPGDPNILVNSVTLNVAVPAAPATAISDVVLNVYLYNIDAANNGLTGQEYFIVRGEDGTILGNTNTTVSDCDGELPLVHPFYFNASIATALSIPSATYNNWASDGNVEFTLEPANPVDANSNPIALSNGINDLCGNSYAKARLQYNAETQIGGTISGYSINGGAILSPVPLNVNLPQGDHLIKYYRDNTDNTTDSCSFEVRVEDNFIPVFQDCPGANFPLNYNIASCDTTLTLPFHGDILDNCNEENVDSVVVETLQTFAGSDNAAEDVTLLFENLPTNISNKGALSIRVSGDIDNSEEFFEIVGEDNQVLGVTNTGGDCESFTTTIIELDQLILQDWASDGVVRILLRPNDAGGVIVPGADGDPDIGKINNHCPGVSNGSKQVKAELLFETYPSVTYSITGATTVASTDFEIDNLPEHIFEQGLSTITYEVADASNNVGSCVFTIDVQDAVDPTLVCRNEANAFINPSGLVTTVLNTEEFIVDTTDNCGIESLMISQLEFDCDDILNSPIAVDIVATDFAGNQTSCSVPVNVETITLSPTYTVGLCGNDTLYLFPDSSVIQSSGGGTFDYQWTGPGFSSTDAAPIILNATVSNAGLYELTMTGTAGCSATGFVEVIITNTPNTPTLTSTPASICNNESARLEAQTFTGNAIQYEWYEGIWPSGSLISSSSEAYYDIAGLSAGTYNYYVIVTIDGCISDPSNGVTLTVSTAPIASTNDDSIVICEGESFQLGTSVTGSNFTYAWSGPNGFLSDLQNPPLFENVTQSMQGTYALIISENSCSSDTVFTEVIIKPIPEKPSITNNSPLCAGASVVVECSVTGANSYEWLSDSGRMDTTTINELLIDGLAVGNHTWQVRIISDDCASEYSDPTTIIIEDIDELNASYNDPLCDGEDLQLFSAFFQDADYVWTGPNGFSAFVQNPLAPTEQGRYYVEVTTQGGCTGRDSIDVEIGETVVIESITNDAGTCVNGTEDITLTATLNPPDNGSYTYYWVGPNGFTSAASNPVIPNATSNDNGNYTLVVTNDNLCSSLPMTTLINVTDGPQAPFLEVIDPLCEGDPLTLEVDPISGGSVTYYWVLPTNDTIPTNSNIFSIPSVTMDYAGNYIVFVENNNCFSAPSNTIVVSITPNPPTPTITGTEAVCSGEDIVLNTQFIPGAEYSWFGPGFISDIPNPVIENASSSNAGEYYLIVTINNCSSPQGTFMVEVNEQPEQPQISNTGSACQGDVIILTSSVINADSFLWTAPDFTNVNTPVNYLTLAGADIQEGNWTVQAIMNGCNSEPSLPIEVIVTTPPLTPSLQVNDNQLCYGDTLDLSINPYPGTNIEYYWITPNGLQVTGDPQFMIPTTEEDDEGEYSVYVVVDGCSSDTSSIEDIEVNPFPLMPQITSNGPICEGEEAMLFTNFVADAIYSWEGPSNFSSNNQNPSFIANANFSGTYELTVIVGGCPSPTATHSFGIVSQMQAPRTENNSPLCLDQLGSALELSILPADAISGASYTWYDASTDTIVGGPSMALTWTINDLNNYNEGSYQFYVIATIDNCETPASIPTIVDFYNIPNVVANAGDTTLVCGDDSAILNGNLPNNINGKWTQICGPTASIGNSDAQITTVDNLISGETYCFLWTLSVPGCGDFSSDEVVVIVDEIIDVADAGPDTIYNCSGLLTDQILQAVQPAVGVDGEWTQPLGQELTGVIIENPSSFTTRVTGLVPGNNYIFTWTLRNIGCQDFSSDQVVVAVIEPIPNIANAGEDFNACGDGSVELEATPPPGGTGTWFTFEPGVNIITPSQANTIATGLNPGPNLFIWLVDYAGSACSAFDSIIVNYDQAPEAFDDVALVNFAESVEINVLDNDNDLGSDLVFISEMPANGTVEEIGLGRFNYKPNPSFGATDEFKYIICCESAPDVCSEATVTVKVTNAECIIPTIITPNGDGVNDQFIIPCLSAGEFPNNSVSIFNQWGDEVYEASPYSNSWEGTYNGQDLPDGTYYFIIEFGGEAEPKTGFLIIQR